MVAAIWNEVPDFRESYEMPDGLRTKVPASDERVVRELLVNALVHRPYTQRGDLYLNLHIDLARDREPRAAADRRHAEEHPPREPPP
jgi:hypothetical protein